MWGVFLGSVCVVKILLNDWKQEAVFNKWKDPLPFKNIWPILSA